MIVDSHAHVISADPARYPLMCPEHDDDPWYRTVPLSTEELLDSMNSAGVERTVLVQPIRAYGNDNRYLADSCAAYQDRFAGVGVLDVEREQDARAKMRQLIQEGGLAGVRLNLAIREDMIDSRFYPLLSYAAELDIPVLLRVTPEQLHLLPALLERFPHVTMVLDHCGFVKFDDGPAWAAAAPLFEIGAHENLFLKVSSLNLYDAGNSADPAVLVRDLAACFGADHLAWGSDYPHTHDRSYAQLVSVARDAARLLPEEAVRKFLGETAARLWLSRQALSRAAGRSRIESALAGGDVPAAADDLTRAAYATGACIYSVTPSGVVFPRDTEDVVATVRLARRLGVSVTARGAGSGRNGAALNSGLIVDFTHSMNRILEIDPDGGWARAQPGVVLRQLNAALACRGVFFPVDPSSAGFCTFGGAFAQNSAGPHGLKYGVTADHVIGAQIVLADGETLRIHPDGRAEAAGDAARRVLDEFAALQAEYGGFVAAHRPHAVRNCDGFNVWDAFAANGQGLLRLLAGSEGTLALVTELVVKLAPVPTHTVVAQIALAELDEVTAVVDEALPLAPAALEFMDDQFLAVRKRFRPAQVDWLPPRTSSVMLVEFSGFSEAETSGRLAWLRARLAERLGSPPVMRQRNDPAGCRELWKLRQGGQKLGNRIDPLRKYTAFVEDVAFDPAIAVRFIREMKRIVAANGVTATIDGHIGVGNLHIYPLLDLKTADDCALMEAISNDFADLIHDVDGCLSGEHGIGIVRTDALRRRHMPSGVYGVFERVKHAFDPGRLLNPDHMVSDQAGLLTRNLRYGPHYAWRETGSFLDDDSVRQEIEKCFGCGKCKVFCPVAAVTGNELHTPRARMNLLRQMGTGQLDFDATMAAPEFRAVVESCTNCKICVTQCFDGVDVGALMSKVRGHYVERDGISLRDRVLGQPALVDRIGAGAPLLANSLLRCSLLRRPMEALTGIAAQRQLPSFASGKLEDALAQAQGGGDRKVAFFAGCWFRHNDLETGAAVIRVLASAGCDVRLTPDICCGMPLLVRGRRAAAERLARRNTEALGELAGAGYDIVTACPTCELGLKRELSELAPSAQSQAIAEKTHDIHAYLLGMVADGSWRAPQPAQSVRVAYHSPCHTRVQGEEDEIAAFLEKVIGANVAARSDSCCGMSGLWGLQRSNFELSEKIAQPVREAVAAKDPDFVVTNCGMCELQLRQSLAQPATQPLRLLDKLLER